MALFPFLSIALADSLNAEEQGGIVLPPMTVFAIKKPDNSFVQKSEIEWHDGNDPTIVRENDGSYTARSTTNSYSLKTLLVSLGRPTVNIDMRYAADSVSMTAEGDLILQTLLESFVYLDEGATLQLTPTLAVSEFGSRSLMNRRLEVLKKTLARSSRIKFKVMPTKTLSSVNSKPGRAEIWRIKVRQEN